MSSSKFTKIQSILRLLEQMSSEKRYQLIRESITLLSIDQMEDLLLEIEQTITLKARLEEYIEQSENTEQRKKIEIKKLNGKYYAYLRWWDKYLRSKYLGILPMQPGKTYRLTHKRHGTVKVVSVVSLNLEDDEQAYLQVQLLEPMQGTRSFHYPKCFKEGNIFSQKDWEIKQQLSSELTTVTSENTQLLASLPTERSAQVHQQRFHSVLQVRKSLTNKLLDQLAYWENLSQALSTSPQWQLIKKSNEFILQNQQLEIIVIYSCETQLLNSPHSAQKLFSWFQAIAWEVANSSFVTKQKQALARRFFIRLQAAPHLDNNRLFAYLFDLLT